MRTMANEPMTRAERTNYRETSLHADVMAFVRELARDADNMKLLDIGRSHEGREMPLLVLSNRRLFDPASAIASGLPIVLVINNIHAGEVEGKEASLILAREIVRGPLRSLADSAVLLLLPLFNVDGNEKISCKNRALDLAVRLDGQIGPDGGVGTRYTGAGLNLNRDHMKVEAVEMANLNREVVYRWHPHLTIDCHTTDGSIHGYELTYGTAMNPASHPGPMDYSRTQMLPAITAALFERTGIRTYFYGNFVDERDPSKGWATYSHLPRYGSHYRGLTNGLDILSETYSYIPFSERVQVNKEFLLEIFRYAAAHGPEMVKVVQQAREETSKRRGDLVPIQSTLDRFEQPVDIVRRGFTVDMVHDTTSGLKIEYRNFKKDSKIETFRIPFFGRFIPVKSVIRPFAYLVPSELKEVIAKLSLHDIQSRTLPQEKTVSVERFRIASVKRYPAADYGSIPKEEINLEGGFEKISAVIPKGTFVVPTAQSQGTLAVYLLEPESDDGLATWGFVPVGEHFPILRVPSETAL
jgi:hypothetical protein